MRNLRHWLKTIAFSSILPLMATIAQPASAQGRQDQLIRFPLLDNANCSHTASHRGSWATVGAPFERRAMAPIIARQLENSMFHIRAPRQQYTLLACNISTEDFDTLTLRMGVADESAARNEEMTINVYQSGSIIAARQSAPPGTIMHLDIDLLNMQHAQPGNISIELLCERSSYSPGCILYFMEAELAPTGNYISGNNNSTAWQRQEAAASRSSSSNEDSSIIDTVVDTVFEEAVEELEGVIEGIF